MLKNRRDKENFRRNQFIVSYGRKGFIFFLLLTLLFIIFYKFDRVMTLEVKSRQIKLLKDKLPGFFYQKFKSNDIFWDLLSQYTPEQIRHYLTVIFPNVATTEGKLEREFFFDSEKKVENEYVDEHSEWPDSTYKLEPPLHQQIGPDVVPGIKDVQYLIRKHQFPMSCENKKFLAPSSLYSGFGSVNHIIGAMIGKAMIEDRIFIWGEKNVIYNRGPFCGQKTEKIHQDYLDKMANRSHTKKKRNRAYFTDGEIPEGFDCFFEKVTNCSIRNNHGAPMNIKYFKPKDNHIVPPIIVPIVDRLKIPKNLSYYYWRLCATAFLYRPNEMGKKWVRELEEDYLVNPSDSYDVSVHVRHGEKSSEMKLVYGDEIMKVIKVICKVLNKEKLNIFVSSEDPKVIEWFNEKSGHSITYFDFHLANFYPKQYTKLASVLVPQMLANMKHSLFANFVIGTIGSNWNRLLIELRMTTAGYANNYYFEVGDHVCLSVEHCKLLKKDFHMNW